MMTKQKQIAEWAAMVALVAAIPLIVVGKAVGDRHGLATASWYGEKYRGKPTASGELFDPDKLTAAHRKLPFGTRVKCTLGPRFVIVTITDRGPFVKGGAAMKDSWMRPRTKAGAEELRRRLEAFGKNMDRVAEASRKGIEVHPSVLASMAETFDAQFLSISKDWRII